jgi:hypothetical protein
LSVEILSYISSIDEADSAVGENGAEAEIL